SLPVGCWRRFRPPPQSGLTWLRFLSPLVTPDVRISRIRLSPDPSDLRSWQVDAALRNAIEAECPVQVLVRDLAEPGASSSRAAHQPTADPAVRVGPDA